MSEQEIIQMYNNYTEDKYIEALMLKLIRIYQMNVPVGLGRTRSGVSLIFSQEVDEVVDKIQQEIADYVALKYSRLIDGN